MAFGFFADDMRVLSSFRLVYTMNSTHCASGNLQHHSEKHSPLFTFLANIRASPETPPTPHEQHTCQKRCFLMPPAVLFCSHWLVQCKMWRAKIPNALVSFGAQTLRSPPVLSHGKHGWLQCMLLNLEAHVCRLVVLHKCTGHGKSTEPVHCGEEHDTRTNLSHYKQPDTKSGQQQSSRNRRGIETCHPTTSRVAKSGSDIVQSEKCK